MEDEHHDFQYLESSKWRYGLKGRHCLSPSRKESVEEETIWSSAVVLGFCTALAVGPQRGNWLRGAGSPACFELPLWVLRSFIAKKKLEICKSSWQQGDGASLPALGDKGGNWSWPQRSQAR